jgi:hypothetical protein|eukprot:COSAG03_NODE_821_length_5733_cov_3.187966_2_plen_36_part_00
MDPEHVFPEEELPEELLLWQPICAEKPECVTDPSV